MVPPVRAGRRAMMSLDLRTGEPLKAGASYADRPSVALPEGELCDSRGSPSMLKEMIEEVAKANEAFYEAFESLDIKKMDEVWAREDYVTCIHPGWNLRSGWPAVRDSWVMIFNNTFTMQFRLTDIMIQVAG